MVGLLLVVFFFNDTATTEIYTLSLHDALPIYCKLVGILTFLTVPCLAKSMYRASSVVEMGMLRINMIIPSSL